MKVSVSAYIPHEYADALRNWAKRNLNPHATEADAIRRLIADALEMPVLPLSYEIEAENVEAKRRRDDRAEIIASMRTDGHTFKSIADHLEISIGRTRQILAIYQRSARRSRMDGQVEL